MTILFYSLSLLPKPLRSSYSPAIRGFFISPICIFLPIYYPILYPHLPYLAPPLHPSYRFLSIIISLVLLSLLFVSVTWFRLHKFPSSLVTTFALSLIFILLYFPYSFSPHLHFASRWSSLSLCLAGSLLVALTARNQYIPFHGQAPLPCTSTLHSWSWPVNPTTLCYPCYVYSLSLPLLPCLCW